MNDKTLDEKYIILINTLEAIYNRIHNGDDYINSTTLDISKAIENSFKIVGYERMK